MSDGFQNGKFRVHAKGSYSAKGRVSTLTTHTPLIKGVAFHPLN